MMKYIWEESDVRIGRFYHRYEDLSTYSKISYAKSCLHKIGVLRLHKHDFKDLKGSKTLDGQKLFVTIAMTDGLVFGPYTASELASILTDGNFRPTTSRELMIILDNRRLNEEDKD